MSSLHGSQDDAHMALDEGSKLGHHGIGLISQGLLHGNIWGRGAEHDQTRRATNAACIGHVDDQLNIQNQGRDVPGLR